MSFYDNSRRGTMGKIRRYDNSRRDTMDNAVMGEKQTNRQANKQTNKQTKQNKNYEKMNPTYV